MAERLCPVCGDAVPETALNCPWCGAPVPRDAPAAPAPPEDGAPPSEDLPRELAAAPTKKRRWPYLAAVLAAALVAAGLLLWGLLPRGGPFEAMSPWESVMLFHEDGPLYGGVNPPYTCLVSREGIVNLSEWDKDAAYWQESAGDGGERRLLMRYRSRPRTEADGEGTSPTVLVQDKTFFYDHGELEERPQWRYAKLSGDGKWVFYQEELPEGGMALFRQKLPDGRPQELDRTEDRFSVYSVGWSGDCVLYATGMSEDGVACSLWTPRGTWTFTGYNSFAGSAGGAVVTNSLDLIASSSYFSSLMPFLYRAAWPQAGEELAFRDLGSYLRTNRDNTQLLYRDPDGLWWFETREGREELDFPEDVTYLRLIAPEGCDGNQPKTLLGCAFVGGRDDSSTCLLYLGRDRSVRVLAECSNLWDAWVDPQVERLMYLDDDVLYRMDDLAAPYAQPRAVTPEDATVSAAYPAPDLSACWYVRARKQLCYLDPEDRSTRVAGACYSGVALPEGGFWFTGENGALYYSCRGGAPTKLPAEVSSLTPLGPDGALALGTGGAEELTGWYLAPDGSTTTLEVTRLGAGTP